jgi:hypothetical protein
MLRRPDLIACFVPGGNWLRCAFWLVSSLILSAEGWIHEQWIMEVLDGSHQHSGCSSRWLDLSTGGFQNFEWSEKEARIKYGWLAAAVVPFYAWSFTLLRGTRW